MANELSELYGLVENGWLRSYREQQCVDKHGAPLPWYTYSAIHFIERRLKPWMHVFEYGCGNSSLWYGRRVRSVDAVDNSPDWVGRVGPLCTGNVCITGTKDTGESYVNAIAAGGKRYDVVAIDGRNRVACARAAVHHLSGGGVIVFDNTDRPRYAEGIAFLRDQGFRRIEFFGVVPMIPDLEETSIFYRPDNVFRI